MWIIGIFQISLMSETKITIEESSKYFQKSIKHVAMQKPAQI